MIEIGATDSEIIRAAKDEWNRLIRERVRFGEIILLGAALQPRDISKEN